MHCSCNTVATSQLMYPYKDYVEVSVPLQGLCGIMHSCVTTTLAGVHQL